MDGRAGGRAGDTTGGDHQRVPQLPRPDSTSISALTELVSSLYRVTP
jgi:hypothetical protein